MQEKTLNNISILPKEDCCGCENCVNVCPKKCISSKSDSHGFIYPTVDRNRCIDCSLCVRMCPVLSGIKDKSEHSDVFYARCKDVSIRLSSSSGGVFYSLAKKVLNEGGIVVGAAFNELWVVEHKVIDTEDELKKLQGSKYVQSSLSPIYDKLKSAFKENKKVLFVGTPCQASAIRLISNASKTDNLTICEVICHGVPSPGIWQQYLDKFHNLDAIKNIFFRDKNPSWEHFSIKIVSDTTVYSQLASEDVYVNGFLKNLFLRPSCYNCNFKGGKSSADLSLGDFWGIDKTEFVSLNDHTGASIVVANSNRGNEVIKSLQLELYNSSIDNLTKYNPAYFESVPLPWQSKLFWNLYKLIGIKAIRFVIDLYRPSLRNRIVNKLLSILYK